jgi:hypothetical protein
MNVSISGSITGLSGWLPEGTSLNVALLMEL